MFKELFDYKKEVDSGVITQNKNIQKLKPVDLWCGNDCLKNMAKLADIKDFLESHIHGIKVQVTGGSKLADKTNPSDYTHEPITIKTFQIGNPYDYSVIEVDGVFMDEYDCAARVYEDYISSMVGDKHIEYKEISYWEHVLMELFESFVFFLDDFYCENNQIFKLNNDECEIIIDDIEANVIGVVNENDSELYDYSIIIICKDKQILLSDENYYVMEVTN